MLSSTFGSVPERARGDEQWLRIFTELCWPGFIWAGYERERGKPTHQNGESMLTWARQHDVTVRAHALIYTAGHPDWFKQLKDPAERMRVAELRVRDVVTQFRGRVPIWDVVNEATVSPLLADPTNQYVLLRDGFKKHLDAVADYVDRAFHWARESDPAAILMINDNRIVNGTRIDDIESLLAELRRRKTPFDAIGVQAHMGAEGRVPLDIVWQNLSRLQQYGSLYITEVTIPSQPAGPLDSRFHRENWWDGWTETTQAQYALGLYTLAFGHPAVRGINYWDFAERMNSWRSAALLREDLTPRPVFVALQRLIRDEWWSRWEGNADQAGTIRMRAYYGDYTAAVTLPGGRTLDLRFSIQSPDQRVVLSANITR